MSDGLRLVAHLILMEKELPAANWTEKIAYFLGRREIFLVEGDSMLPILKDGDYVFINPHAQPNVGDIVLARHPFKQSVKIIKRVAEISPEGKFTLLGDNLAESTDSRSFGALAAKNILGKAESKLKKNQ